MFLTPTTSANANTQKASSNATLFNLSTGAANSSTTSNNTVTTSTFSIGSSPLSTPQQFKPPLTSQNVLQKSTSSPSAPLTSSLSFGSTVPSTTTPVLNFGGLSKTATTSNNSPSFSSLSTAVSSNTNLITTTSSSSSIPASTTALTSSIANKPVTSAGANASQQQNLTFQQLEELILNKWTAELYEQEKVFLNQATQINIWDKVINENAEKLTQLHSTMEKVCKHQTKINDDLEIIFTHQKDLEACLVPMEKEDLLSVLKADPNRKNLYINAKKIDSQIKTMSEDLKETIEHINETSRSHDTEDPVIQVGRILNAHMESLRWIDEHTARMQDYFDSLLKMHDDLRRECEISKHDVY